MRFYDFMTMVWAVLWAVLAGWFVFFLADGTRPGDHQRAAFVLGGLAVMGMATCVVLWRMFKDPG